MASSAQFRLKRSGLLLALIAAAFAGQAGAAAGRVEFAVGDVTVAGVDGIQRSLFRGAQLNSGQTVRTNDGRVQVRMTDGAFISLQPDTEFGIKEYRFEGKTDGSESAFYSLVKGAMRTVTGAIGRVNRNKYLVTTSTATVGIRGTGGLIQILPDGATLVRGTSGIWFLANPAGSIDIPAGVSGVAPADPTQPPLETSVAPTAGPTPPTDQQGYVQGDQSTAVGAPVIPPPPPAVLLSGSGYAATVVYGESSGFASSQFLNDFTARFDAAGRMTDITDNLALPTFFTLGGGGAHADFGTDGILAWGRWISTVTGDTCGEGCVLNESYNANQGLHYVIGMPTPSMPPSGMANYNLLGATRPTYVDGSGNTRPGTFSGSLSVNFTALTVGMSLNAAMSDGRGYAIGGSAPITGNLFVGTNFTGLSTSGSGGACTGGCDALVNGFFAGANAERAGLGYRINDVADNKSVIGAAAFKKQ